MTENLRTEPSGGAVARARSFWRRILRGPSDSARIRIYEELAPMLAAGIGLREALRSTADRASGARRRAVTLLADGVDGDAAMSAVMRANPETFTVIEAALVETGERTGRLDVAFRAASAQLERGKAVRAKMWQSVSYPLLLVHCFILMCSLVRMFGGGSFWLLALPSFAALWGAIFLGASFHAANAGSVGWSRTLRNVPLVGTVRRIGSMSRFMRVFGALQGGGAAYGESLLVAGQASGDALVCADAVAAADLLQRGAPMSAALSSMTSIPADEMGLLLAGEKAGELEGSALRVAALEEARFDLAVGRLAGVLKNGLVLLMGVAVAWYAVSFYAGLYKGIL